MKDEIKEILDKLKDTADTSFFAVCGSQEELNKMPKSITKILSISSKDAKILLDYITNLQEIAEEHKNCTRKHWQQKCAEHCANEMIYKSRNEKAIEYIKNTNFWGIYEDVPMSEVKYGDELLDILQGEDNTPQENLYKYTPEKGFRLVGNDNE